MSEFHIDYERVRKVLAKTNFLLAENDSLVRNLTYLLDDVRREAKEELEKKQNV